MLLDSLLTYPERNSVSRLLFPIQFGGVCQPAGVRKVTRMGVAPAAKPAEDKPVLSLKVGDRIKHATLGAGTVTGIEGEGPRTVARIRFGLGEKRLLVRMAPMQKIS